MKLVIAASTILGTLAFTVLIKNEGVHGHEQDLLRGRNDLPQDRKLQGDCPFSQLFSELNLGACIEASGEGRNSRVQLGRDCAPLCPPDENGLMRMEGTQICLQVSHGEGAEDGSKLRLYPCDATNELQQFTWIDDSDPHPLKLVSPQYSDFCVTNRGVNARVGDPIIFKVCDDLRPVERQFWWGD